MGIGVKVSTVILRHSSSSVTELPSQVILVSYVKEKVFEIVTERRQIQAWNYPYWNTIDNNLYG